MEQAAAEADAGPLRGGSVPDEWVRADGEVDLGLRAQADARTAPPSPSPTDAEAAASEESGASWGPGASSPPDPSEAALEPPAGSPVAGWADAAVDAAVPLADPSPDNAADRAPAAFERPVRWRAVPEAGTGGGTGAGADDSAPLAPGAEAPAAAPAAGDPDAGPEPDSRAGAAASAAVRSVRSEPRRLTATPLAMSTTRADAIASPTYAPRRCCSAKKVLPQTPQADRTG